MEISRIIGHMAEEERNSVIRIATLFKEAFERDFESSKEITNLKIDKENITAEVSHKEHEFRRYREIADRHSAERQEELDAANDIANSRLEEINNLKDALQEAEAIHQKDMFEAGEYAGQITKEKADLVHRIKDLQPDVRRLRERVEVSELASEKKDLLLIEQQRQIEDMKKDLERRAEVNARQEEEWREQKEKISYLYAKQNDDERIIAEKEGMLRELKEESAPLDWVVVDSFDELPIGTPVWVRDGEGNTVLLRTVLGGKKREPSLIIGCPNVSSIQIKENIHSWAWVVVPSKRAVKNNEGAWIEMPKGDLSKLPLGDAVAVKNDEGEKLIIRTYKRSCGFNHGRTVYEYLFDSLPSENSSLNGSVSQSFGESVTHYKHV